MNYITSVNEAEQIGETVSWHLASPRDNICILYNEFNFKGKCNKEHPAHLQNVVVWLHEL